MVNSDGEYVYNGEYVRHLLKMFENGELSQYMEQKGLKAATDA